MKVEKDKFYVIMYIIKWIINILIIRLKIYRSNNIFYENYEAGAIYNLSY